jgi:hypothetical protein
MMRATPKDNEKKCPQITQITLIFFVFFIICVNLCNLWAYFHGRRKFGKKPGNFVGGLRVAGKVERKGVNAFIMVSRFFSGD